MVIGQAVTWGLVAVILQLATSFAFVTAPIVIFTAALVSAYDAADKLIKKLDKLPSGVKNAMNPVGTGLDIGKKLGGRVETGLRAAIGRYSRPKPVLATRKA